MKCLTHMKRLHFWNFTFSKETVQRVQRPILEELFEDLKASEHNMWMRFFLCSSKEKYLRKY
jgi:hypothetical protein